MSVLSGPARTRAERYLPHALDPIPSNGWRAVKHRFARYCKEHKR
jgi:hypothetical protein